MINWAARVNPSHPYLENDPAPPFAPPPSAHFTLALVCSGYPLRNSLFSEAN